MVTEIERIRQNPWKLVVLLLLGGGLVLVFLFQQTNWFGLLFRDFDHPYVAFAFNKTLRLLLNDFMMLGILHVWFSDAKITRLALLIQAIDTLILLPIYLLVKLSIDGDAEITSPLLSQWHRLIVNPTLMILIFPAIYFQRYQKSA